MREEMSLAFYAQWSHKAEKLNIKMNSDKFMSSIVPYLECIENCLWAESIKH